MEVAISTLELEVMDPLHGPQKDIAYNLIGVLMEQIKHHYRLTDKPALILFDEVSAATRVALLNETNKFPILKTGHQAPYYNKRNEVTNEFIESVEFMGSYY
jgi:hypothetical protein